MMSRLLKIIVLFCKRALKRDDILQKRPIIIYITHVNRIHISIHISTENIHHIWGGYDS